MQLLFFLIEVVISNFELKPRFLHVNSNLFLKIESKSHFLNVIWSGIF